MKITIITSKINGKIILKALRKRYSEPKMSLNKLCKVAIQKEVLAEIESSLNEYDIYPDQMEI